MDFPLKNGIFFVLGLSIIFYAVYGFKITTRYFRVKNHSKDFKKCTGNLLSKHAEHGFRVSALTGKCEEMKSDDMKEDGYSYAETIIMGEQFTKPVEKFDDILWPISKGIKPGFRFDMYASVQNDWDEVQSFLWYRHFNYVSVGTVTDSGIILLSEESDLRNGTRVKTEEYLDIIGIGPNILKFSVLAQSESVKILLNNQAYFTYHLNMTNIHALHELLVKRTSNEFGINVALHGYRIRLG